MSNEAVLRLFGVLFSICALTVGVGAASSVCQKKASADPALSDGEIAARFSPIFYQALGDKPRSDYITKFDFDGDWRGDNNWANLDDKRFLLKAYIYYSVVETSTHIFIHYAVFHPRDYKGGERKGAILSELIREGAKRGGKYDPTGLAEEAALAHENDMEGCLVVVARNGADLARARVVFVETLHHNNFSRYAAEEVLPAGFDRVQLEGQHPLLYIEPKGHGIEAFLGSDKQVSGKVFLLYKFSGKAQDPGERVDSILCRDPETTPCVGFVGYDLISIAMTLWAKAHDAPNATYAEECDYGNISVQFTQSNGDEIEKKISVHKIGCAFVGRVGGQNMARPPWAWFDRDQRDQPLGRWFFDPATTIKRDYRLADTFSTSYIRAPFWSKQGD